MSGNYDERGNLIQRYYFTQIKAVSENIMPRMNNFK